MCLVTVITSDMLDVLEMTTVHAKYPENGRINKPAVTRPPPKPHFPISVDNLEEYIMSRKANDYEELRREYMVRLFCLRLFTVCNLFKTLSLIHLLDVPILVFHCALRFLFLTMQIVVLFLNCVNMCAIKIRNIASQQWRIIWYMC